LGRAVADLPAGVSVAATDPATAYWLAQGSPISLIPPTSDSATSFEEQLRSGAIDYLAYFDGTPTSLGPDVLARSGVRLHLVGRFSDGSLYRVDSS
jgi:hypothetical protein